MKILLIESDDSFASSLRDALEARGLDVVATADGKEGLDLAHAQRPAAIVLAVELGDKLTGGYAYCNKLKKDDDLRSIPLVLISSQATRETFEQHKKLKTRAEEYLIKPFSPGDLLEKLALHVTLPEGDIAVEDVSLDGEGVQVEEVDSFEIDSSPAEEVKPPAADDEDEWALDALTEMSDDAMPPSVKVASLSPGPAKAAPTKAPEPVRAPEPKGSPGPARALRSLSPGPRGLTPGPAGAEASLQIAELKGQVAELESTLETARRDLQEAKTEAEAQARRLDADLARKDAAVKTAQARADAAQAQTRKLEATLAALKADAGRMASLEQELATLGHERDEAEAGRQAAEARVASLEADARGREDKLKAELDAARRELSEVRTRADAEGDRLRARVADLESDASRNEERVVKAYQKIKGDERVKEKTKKALAIALQLLEEHELDEAARS